MTPAIGTVFVIDDNPAVRKSIQVLFHAAGFYVETYASSREFLAAYDPRRPGCLVLDLKLRGESGLDLLDELATQRAALPVIVLTAHGSVPTSVRAMKAGAIDFVEKAGRPSELVVRVREALELGRQRQKADAAQTLIEQRAARLTPREQQVAELLLEGKGSKQIAASLGVSRRTVEFHRSRLLAKMQVRSTAELVATLLRARVVPER
jgi:two-component system, LuxR family, response regulator FixJ